MNITGRQTRTTIVFGFICAVAFVPARMITDYIDLIQHPTDFRLILWIYLAGYAFLLTRWGKTPRRKILFSLLLPLLFIGWQSSDMVFFLCILGVLSQIRSSLCFPGALFKTVAAEALICFGSAALVAYLAPRSMLAWSLGVWMFFLGQSLYFIFVTDSAETDNATETDAFEKARHRAEKLLADQLP